MSKGRSSNIIIGTRGSELALWQANFTKATLEKQGLKVELRIIKTKGDATQQWNLSFDKLEGKGFFTKELEDALLASEIDLAVHSCKDLPTENAPGLLIAAYSGRANPFDLLLIRKECVDASRTLRLKENAKVGTSSARRKAQLLALRPDITLEDLRGNVPTRVQKLAQGNYDAIVLASAGLERLQVDLSPFDQVALKAPMFIPAPAQGVLAFQIREEDEEMKQICRLLSHEGSTLITNIERTLLHDFQGGCQIPLGVYSQMSGDEIHTWVSYAQSWNAVPKRIHFTSVVQNGACTFDSDAIVRQIRGDKKKSVFISSAGKQEDYLFRVLQAHGYEVHSASLIDFKALPFSFDQDTDWLFFSSKNGVKFFFEQAQPQFDPHTTKLAAINAGTAAALYESGYTPDFIGEGADLSSIAAQFDQLASGKIVFPQARNSMQTIQKGLQKNKMLHTLVVYENTPMQDVPERREEILVFTSPMSAKAYFSINSLQPFQELVSIGKTTTKCLNELGMTKLRTAFEPTSWSIADEIFSI